MPHILIAAAEFYQDIAATLVEGAAEALTKAGATYDKISVPGAFELPGAIALAHASSARHYDGYIALGCVIRGETSHYDLVCNECARGLNELVLRHHIALGFGVATVETREQAYVRADKSRKNMGGRAAEACLAMIGLQQHYGIRA